MKPKQTQLNRIIHRLNEFGYISRNECLRNFISRLGAYIIILKKKGWDFSAKEKDGDYVYTVIQKPPKDEYIQFEVNGERKARRVIEQPKLI